MPIAAMEPNAGEFRLVFFLRGHSNPSRIHWAVGSHSAVKLITRIFEVQRSDPLVGRAQALRQAMLDVSGTGSDPAAHPPAFWAPFVAIGARPAPGRRLGSGCLCGVQRVVGHAATTIARHSGRTRRGPFSRKDA